MRTRLIVLIKLLAIATISGGCQAPAPRRGVDPNAGPTSQPGATEPASTDDAFDPDAPAPGPIEVREEEYESGAVAQRVEGYVGADGELVPHGVTTIWYEDGVKKSELGYAHGTRHGARTTWYPTGQLWAQGAYVNGLEDGTWTAWWHNGFRQREWHMVHGMWDGPFIEWHGNGEKKQEFEYVNGLRQGPILVWDDRGTLVYESEYVDDIKQPK